MCNGAMSVLFNFTLEYAIRGVWAQLGGLEILQYTPHEVLVYADDGNILGENI
jgi:hypothetical protein